MVYTEPMSFSDFPSRRGRSEAYRCDLRLAFQVAIRLDDQHQHDREAVALIVLKTTNPMPIIVLILLSDR